MRSAKRIRMVTIVPKLSVRMSDNGLKRLYCCGAGALGVLEPEETIGLGVAVGLGLGVGVGAGVGAGVGMGVSVGAGVATGAATGFGVAGFGTGAATGAGAAFREP